jgi:hypothetical protein
MDLRGELESLRVRVLELERQLARMTCGAGCGEDRCEKPVGHEGPHYARTRMGGVSW